MRRSRGSLQSDEEKSGPGRSPAKRPAAESSENGPSNFDDLYGSMRGLIDDEFLEALKDVRRWAPEEKP